MVTGVYLFDLASKQGAWLDVRAAAVAGNVANANTPGYKARDVEPFSAVLNKAAGGMAVTNARHIGAEQTSAGGASKVKKADSWETFVSGNAVSVEQELMKSGEVSRHHQMGVGIVRSFHKLMIATAKGGA